MTSIYFPSIQAVHTNSDPDKIGPDCPQYDTAQEGGSLFEKKLLRKLTEKPNSDWIEWVKSFADKISFCHYVEVREGGITLANRLLDFPDDSPLSHAVRDHLEQMVQSEVFLNECINTDEFALNQAGSIIKRFSEAVEVTAIPSKLLNVNEIPENVKVNPAFISDPRIMLYNIFAKTGQTQLSPIDDTIEMELALILADLRKKFLKRLIPDDIKDKAANKIYLKNKLQSRLTLIETEKATVDEKIINLCLKRMSPTLLMSYILEGGNSLAKYDYINSDSKKSRFDMPISKHQGYQNTEIMIDHVHHAINSQNHSNLRDRVSLRYNDVSKLAIKALLYSTGYLCNQQAI